MYQRLILNLKPTKGRFEMLEGVKHIVANGVGIVEGVHAGNKGPILYLGDELSKNIDIANHKPVVLYHPTMNGQAISACEPTVLSSRKVGILLNTTWEAPKLKLEAWCPVDRLKKLDKGTYDKIVNGGELIELSTGMFSDTEDVEGEWNGEPYVGIARNIRMDHLALLPDGEGACSCKDGCGLLANSDGRPLNNELSMDSKRAAVYLALRAKLEVAGQPWGGYIEDMYSDFVIYSVGGVYYKLGYKAEESGVVLLGAPQKVMRVIEYESAGGSILGNAAKLEKEKDMARKDQVDQLIANKHWEEDDREFLMKLDETGFKTVLKKAEKKVAPTTNETLTAAAQTGGSQVAAPVAQTPTFITLDQLDPSIREAVGEALSIRADLKGKTIETILANKAKHGFTKEALEAMPLKTLQGIAAMAATEEHQEPINNLLAPNYRGQATIDPNQETSPEVQPLTPMVINWREHAGKNDKVAKKTKSA